MTVTFKPLTKLDPTAVLYTSNRTAKEIAKAAVLSMIEANVEMILDSNLESRADMQDVLNNSHEHALDAAADLIGDLMNSVIAEIESLKYTATVKSISYIDDQMNDVFVDVSFDEKKFEI